MADDNAPGDAGLAFLTTAAEKIPALLPEVDLAAMRMVMALHRVANVLVYDLESAVHRPGGWSWSAFRALFTLWINGPTQPHRLAELSGMSRPAVSALLKTLEADGLVDRLASPTDGRSVTVSLSPTGRTRLESVYRDHNARETQWAAALSPAELATLLDLLAKLAATGQQPWVSHRF